MSTVYTRTVCANSSRVNSCDYTSTMATKSSTDQLTAWRALYRADTLLFAQLDNTLRANTDMSYFEREVLSELDLAGGRLRMAPLAERLMLSRSGTTRLVAKLEEKNGWVARSASPDDRRATWAELTDDGKAALAKAAPIVDAVVAAFFADRLSPAELRRSANMLNRLADANQGITMVECDV